MHLIGLHPCTNPKSNLHTPRTLRRHNRSFMASSSVHIIRLKVCYDSFVILAYCISRPLDVTRVLLSCVWSYCTIWHVKHIYIYTYAHVFFTIASSRRSTIKFLQVVARRRLNFVRIVDDQSVNKKLTKFQQKNLFFEVYMNGNNAMLPMCLNASDIQPPWWRHNHVQIGLRHMGNIGIIP